MLRLCYVLWLEESERCFVSRQPGVIYVGSPQGVTLAQLTTTLANEE